MGYTLSCNYVFYSCLGKVDLWFNLVQTIFQHSSATLHSPSWDQAPTLDKNQQPRLWALGYSLAVTGLGKLSGIRCKGFKIWNPKALNQNFQEVHTEHELQSYKDFKKFSVWWHNVDTYVIRSPNKKTHGRLTRTENNVWGYNFNFSGCPNGMKGLSQGRSSYESQDVLYRQILGNVPPMPVIHGAGKQRKFGISVWGPLSPFQSQHIHAQDPVTLGKFLAILHCSL